MSAIGSTPTCTLGLRLRHPPHHHRPHRALGWSLAVAVRRSATAFKARTTQETMATMRAAPLRLRVRSP